MPSLPPDIFLFKRYAFTSSSPLKFLTFSVAECLEANQSHKDGCVSPFAGVWHSYDLKADGETLIPRGGELPPNFHGPKPFIVKLQTSANRDNLGGHALQISDRKENFLLWFGDDVSMEKPRQELTNRNVEGTHAVEFYRWAIRPSDQEIKVCIDTPPSRPVFW